METDGAPCAKPSDRTTLVWFIAPIVIIGSLIVNAGVKSTPIGEWMQFQAFSGLHALLPAFERDPLPVVVVNIHDLSPIDDDDRHAESISQLQSIVKQIAVQQPLAIGIDLDFSPKNRQSASAADSHFLDYCKTLSTGVGGAHGDDHAVAVFLGVGRSMFGSPDQWLGGPEYANLAAAIQIPQQDTRRLPRWYVGPAYGGQRYLPSMASALSNVYFEEEGKTRPIPPLLAHLVESMPSNPMANHSTPVAGIIEAVEQLHARGFKCGLAPVNYSKMEELKRETLHSNVVDGKAQITGLFRGKIVLIGDTDTADVFTDPGLEQPVRGVYLQASALYTYIVQPLYEFKHSVALALDLLASAVLTVVLWRVEEEEQQHPYAHNKAHSFVLFAVLVLGWLFVRFASVLWLDFIAIFIALAIHPSIEKYAHHRISIWQRKHQQDEKQTATEQHAHIA